jgi:hypothetical protein
MTADQRRRMIADRKETIERLWCKDDWQLFDVFRVPAEALLLNVDNRRFAAERKLMEEKLGHPLDPENATDDETSVISILLDTSLDVDGNKVVGQGSKGYEALKSDWQRRKQERPFWIRPDGTVRNGNRRLAMLKRLRSEGGLDGTEWVDAIILDPSTINEHDLFEMEQREQLTEDFKVRYTDINLLLALRDAAITRNVDWADPASIERVAGELQHVAGGDDKAYAVIQLQAIRYMDAYLEDSNAPGEYQKLLRQVERFRDVGKVMSQVESEYPDDAADMLRLTFAMIRAGMPHDDIRSIRKMFIHDRQRYEQLLHGIEGDEQAWQPSTEAQLADPNLAADMPDGNGENDVEPPGPVVPNYPGAKVKTRINNAIDGFRAASSLATTLDVASALEQVMSRLNALASDPNTLESALLGDNATAVRKLIQDVIEWTRNAEQLLTRE